MYTFTPLLPLVTEIEICCETTDFVILAFTPLPYLKMVSFLCVNSFYSLSENSKTTMMIGATGRRLSRSQSRV